MSLLRWACVASVIACTGGQDASPRPAPPVREPVAPAAAAPAPAVLAIDGPAASTPSGPSSGRFGVLWRTAIPGMDPGSDDTDGVIVIGNEIFVSTPTEIHVFDLATGAKLRSAAVAHTWLVAARDALVARNDQEEFGLDKQTLQPTWHAPAPNFIGAVGEFVLETPMLTQPQLLRLRRASDGHVMWENGERLFATGTAALLDGGMLYVRAYAGVEADHVAALDVATGAVRWRTAGYLASASGGRVVIQDAHAPPPSYRVLDATGRVLWRSSVAWLWTRGDIAYASMTDRITAIDLASNQVLWRRTGASASESDDKWLYGITPKGVLQVVDRMTGELVGEIQLGNAFRFQGTSVVRFGGWLLRLGPLSAPEQRKPVVARGCLFVTGCQTGRPVPAGTKVTIDGTTTTTTDRRGCFQARATLGIGPASLEVTSGDPSRPLQLDTDFPRAAIFDGSSRDLNASYIGGGCHDARGDLR